jgi:tetratricopeptide (TPR) repeat protein
MESFIDLELHNNSRVEEEIKYLENRHQGSLLGLYFKYRAAVLRDDPVVLDDLVAKLQVDPILKPLAYKIQIRSAVRIGNYSLALQLTEDALQKFPSAWFYKSAIFMCIHGKQFEDALNYLREGGRTYNFGEDYESYLFSVIWYQYAKFLGPENPEYVDYLQKSHEANLNYTQPAIHLAQKYYEKDQIDRAKKVLRETWDVQKKSYTIAMAYANLGKDKTEQARYAKELYENDLDSAIAQLILILKYTEAKLWAEARHVLNDFMRRHGDNYKFEVDYLKAILAHEELGEAQKAYQILRDILRENLRRKWTCRYCGYQSDTWQPLCESCDRFDHLDHSHVTQNPLLLPFIP